MTWILCHRCNSIPCICRPLDAPVVGTLTFTPQLPIALRRLTADEIERIAKRVAELIKEKA